MRSNVVPRVLLSLMAALNGVTHAGESESAVITLTGTCRVNVGLVLLADIARIEATDERLKDELSRIDIADVSEIGTEQRVTSKLVRIRLRLEGLDPSRIRIVGVESRITAVRAGALPASFQQSEHERVSRPSPNRADSLVVPAPAPLPQATNVPDGIAAEPAVVVESVARQAVLRQLPQDPKAFTIRLMQPVRCEPGLGTLTAAQCEARLRSGTPVGRVVIDVVINAGGPPQVCPVMLEVRQFETIVMTTRPIPRGRTIQAEDLYLNRWDVTGMNDYCTDLKRVVGQVATHTLTGLQVVRGQDLSGGDGSTAVAIRRQSRVDMVCRVGDFSVIARGEALQDGKVGDSIRLQNVDSKAVVQGRVISAGQVEVDY